MRPASSLASPSVASPSSLAAPLAPRHALLRPPSCLRRYPAVCQRDPTLLRRRHLHIHAAATSFSGWLYAAVSSSTGLGGGDVRRVCSPGRRLGRRPSALSRLASAPAPHPPTPHAGRGSRPQTPPPVPTRVISGSRSAGARGPAAFTASRSGSGGSLQPHTYLCREQRDGGEGALECLRVDVRRQPHTRSVDVDGASVGRGRTAKDPALLRPPPLLSAGQPAAAGGENLLLGLGVGLGVRGARRAARAAATGAAPRSRGAARDSS